MKIKIIPERDKHRSTGYHPVNGHHPQTGFLEWEQQCALGDRNLLIHN